MSSVTNFVPKRRLVADVTNSSQAEVTTDEDHNYQTGFVVKVIVPEVYGMTLYEQTTITVTGATTFLTTIDTTSQAPFSAPTFVAGGYGFTQAQIVPMSGVTDNIAGQV